MGYLRSCFSHSHFVGHHIIPVYQRIGDHTHIHVYMYVYIYLSIYLFIFGIDEQKDEDGEL